MEAGTAQHRNGFTARLKDNVSRVLLGKDETIELALTALLAGGHLLIEDKPGVGKTVLARSIARSLGLPFQRVQCTADLLPSDLLGAHVYHPTNGDITFQKGPVFTSVLVADELNRTPPRTQSALLQCMAEGRVSIGRQTEQLPDPFFVIATQNPMSFAGTYPLPENQLDRFLMRIRIGYPDGTRELEIVAQEDGHRLLESLEPVADREALLAARAAVDKVHVEREIVAYIVELARRTRASTDIELGVSPRGAQALHRACRARAVLENRDYVVPDDVHRLILPVFGHRMTLHGRNVSPETLLTGILAETGAPD